MEFDLNRIPDLDTLNRDALQALLRQLEELYGETEAREPEDEDSEEYEDWLNDLNDVEDLMDEIEERLEEAT